MRLRRPEGRQRLWRPRHGDEQESDQRRVTGHLRRSLFAWGLIDQALSSATTFFLTLIAARSLGPAGLGTIALGYASFLVVLGVHRTLLVDPLVTRVAVATRSTSEAFRAATSTTATAGGLASLVALAVGLVGTGAVARGMLVFSPWFVPALLQALLRSWLYREGRGAVATLSSGAWLLTMAAAVAVGLRSTDWQISAAWGLGACVAVAVAVAGTGIGLASPRAAGAWFNYGRYGSAVGAQPRASCSAQRPPRVSGMSAILGPAAVGGYRSVESIFAPTSLLGPALSEPRHADDAGSRRARRRPRMDSGPEDQRIEHRARARVHRADHARQRSRPAPLRPELSRVRESDPADLGGCAARWHVDRLTILLLAARKMNQLGFLVIVNSVLTLALTLPLAALFGLEAAAWGIVVGAFPPLVLIVLMARRAARELDAPRRDQGIVERVLPTASIPERSS